MIDVENFRVQAREWLRTVSIPDVPLKLDERFRVLREWQTLLYDAGWIGIAWSIEAGGRGLSLRHQLAFSEELIAAGAPEPVGLIGLDVVGPSIDRFGSPSQRQELLPRLLSGEDIWCQGFSEPNAGSDLASMRTRAVEDGDTFLISGQKVWTSWGKQATWCALLARSGGADLRHKSISYLLVPMHLEGITVRPIVQMTGDEEFCEVFFDEVRVPKSHLLGEIDQGWAIAMHTLGTERGYYTLRRRVEDQAALDEVVKNLRASKGTGGNPSDFVASSIGEAFVALKALEGQTHRTVGRLSESDPGPEDSVDKLLLNTVEQRVYELLVDLLGPHRTSASSFLGLDTQRLVHDHYYSRATSIYGGTSQIQRNIIAQRILRLPND